LIGSETANAEAPERMESPAPSSWLMLVGALLGLLLFTWNKI